jgi:hypothetical protein
MGDIRSIKFEEPMRQPVSFMVDVMTWSDN